MPFFGRVRVGRGGVSRPRRGVAIRDIHGNPGGRAGRRARGGSLIGSERRSESQWNPFGKQKHGLGHGSLFREEPPRAPR